MDTTKKFRVVSVSDNTNSFGLHGIVLVAEDGVAFEVGRYNSGHNTEWKQGADVVIPLDVNGKPTWAMVSVEIPRKLPKVPHAVLVEIFPNLATYSQIKVPVSLSDAQADRIGAVLAREFGLKRDREHRDRYQTENGTFTARGIARRALFMIIEGL